MELVSKERSVSGISLAEVEVVEASQNTSAEFLKPWIPLLGSEVETDRLRARTVILNQDKYAVLPLIAAYASTEDEQVQQEIINILALISEEAVETLIQQLIEGNLRRKECARRTLPRIASSLPKLLALIKTKSDLTNEIQPIIHKLAANLGYSSLEQLITNYQKSTQRATQLVSKTHYSDLHVKRVVKSLDEAQKCLDAELYSQTFISCDQVVQQLLMTLLKYFKIKLGKDTNKMRTVLTALHKHGIHIKSEQKLRWLRSIRNLIRYKQKRANKREANQALHTAQFFVHEVKLLLKSDLKNLRIRESL